MALIASLAGVGATAACKRSADSSVTAHAAPSAALFAATRPDSPRLADPQWKLAAEGDRAELARLADREGAQGLLQGVEDGGEVARTALAALALADDGEFALGRLGQIAAQLSPSEAVYVLDALSAIAAQPYRQTEPLDREGVRTCAASLLEIAGRARDPARVRASAISTLRLLADRRWVDTKTIPRELDAPPK